MIEELRMRPFVRPLFIWITGILLQVVFPCRMYGLLLILFPLFILVCSGFVHAGQGSSCSYETRWVWGAVFALLLLALSIEKTAYSQIEIEHPPFVSGLQRLASEEQQRLLKPFDRLHLSDSEKGMLATITLGYRAGMDRTVRKRFSMVGVAHILAVSGFHVAIVCGFLSLIFSAFPRTRFFNWIKYLLTIVLLWTFVFITGLAPSAVRAAIMLSLFLTGRLLRRTTDGYNILAAAAFCMLVYEPLYLFDIGFQLSYAAVFFILYLQPRFMHLIGARNPFLAVPSGWISVTMAAQIGTSFLCLYYFGQFSLVFLFTNLPLTVLAMLLIPAGLLWALLPAGCPGSGELQLAVEWLVNNMLGVVDTFSRVPFASVSFRFGLDTMLLAYGSLLFGLLYEKSRRPFNLFIALSLLLIMLITLVIEKVKIWGM
ncbi:ComEC/Rec2 family competence protein [Parabacteroides sp. AM08-6]|nr:ComEC/Rec2 family competence protein [Parabacteroides sp. AM08-6]